VVRTRLFVSVTLAIIVGAAFFSFARKQQGFQGKPCKFWFERFYQQAVPMLGIATVRGQWILSAPNLDRLKVSEELQKSNLNLRDIWQRCLSVMTLLHTVSGK
jgi:hypothetical protein